MLQNARVLRPEFVPRQIQHRDTEHTALTESLEPLIRGEQADPVILTGPTGVGKTTLAKYTLEQLQEAAFEIEGMRHELLAELLLIQSPLPYPRGPGANAGRPPTVHATRRID